MPQGKKTQAPMDLIQPTRPFRQVLTRPHDWAFDIPVAVDEQGNKYWPIGILCDWLGIVRSVQRRKLRTHHKIKEYGRYYLLDGGGGVQATWTIREDGVGTWITTIDDSKVKDHQQDLLRQFQEDVARYADYRLRGFPQESDLLIPGITPDDERILSDPQVQPSVIRLLQAMRVDVDILKFSFLRQNTHLGDLEKRIGLIEGMQAQFGKVSLPPTTLVEIATDEDDEDE